MLSANLTELIVNLSVMLVVFSFVFVFIWKLKNITKAGKFFFVFYFIFWIPLKLLRDYTGILQNGIDQQIIWLPILMYGLVGVFIRPLADYLSSVLKNRKLILHIAIGVGIITFVPVIFIPNTVTNTLQSVGVGFGASMIGIYQLLFKEQFGQQKSFLTVLVLALPPLLADFVASPIQSVFKILAISNPDFFTNYLAYLWAVGLVFYLVAFGLLFFIPEDRSKIQLLNNQTNTVIIQNHNKQEMFFLSLLFFIGFCIAFFRFTNSGTIATLTIQILAEKQNQETAISSLQAYLSVSFSLSQLLGTFFLARFLIVKTNKIQAFGIGIFSWLIFQIAITINQDPYLYFGVSFLNGFAYGILYNLVLGYVLQFRFNTNKINPMGIYQGVLAIGIMSAAPTTQLLRGYLNGDTNSIQNLNLIIIFVMLLVFATYGLAYWFDLKLFQKKYFLV